MKHLTFIFILLLTGLTSNAQNIPDLKSMIISADTILLVSHEQTDYIIVDEKTGKESEPAKVMINGRPNKKVITESVILSESARQTLLKLFDRKNADRTIETCNSFVPLHSILLLKEGKGCFVDISFGCNNFVVVTKNSSTNPIYFGKENTRNLEIFFKRNGILIY
jgi:hypothetical protein